MEVSIIIPVFRDWERLSICLKALSNQSFPKELFEIIVVNNDPQDLVPDSLFCPENCTMIVEAKPGSYAARNAALQLSQGRIIGFTDSDCVPRADWIKKAVDFLDNRGVDRVAGHIDIFYRDETQPTLAELYDKVFSFKQEEVVRSIASSVTGNMFSYRYVFDKVGAFNHKLLSGGDHEWSLRANKAGYNIAYGEEVVIFHPARVSMSELVKKAKRVGGGKANVHANNFWKSFRSFLKAFRPSPYSFKMILKYGKELSLLDKIRVFFVRYFVFFTTELENLKVSIGSKALRD